MKYKDYVELAIWVVSFVVIGKLLGMYSMPDIDTWYATLQKSSLTPPGYVFGVVWTVLYILLAIAGWIVWNTPFSGSIQMMKLSYTVHMLLNWSWSILFFNFHYIGLSLINIVCVTTLALFIAYKAYKDMPIVTALFTPYLAWLFFAAYLNIYIWYYYF